MQYKRLYKDMQDGTAIALPYVQCPKSGSLHRAAVSNKKPVAIEAVEALGCPISKTSKSKKMVANAPTINVDENTDGQLRFSRNEQPSMDMNVSREVTIELENTTANPVTHIIGDSHTLITTKQAYGVLPAGVLVGGTYVADTLAFLAKISGPNPMRFHGIHVVNTNGGAGSTNFFSGDNLFMLEAEPDFSSVSRGRVSFKTSLKAGNFDNSIQEIDNFRFFLDGLTGLEYTLNPGEKIVITMTLRSIQRAYDMVLKGGKGLNSNY